MERNGAYRFRKNNRLLNATDFGRVFKGATCSRDKWFTVLCRDNHGAPARLGLAISKKNCRKATSRNKIKRMVRESFRQHKELLEGFDIVVINQPAAVRGTRDQVVDSLSRHWRRCQMSKRHSSAKDE